MKNTLYFNCSSGIAGDMIIASLLDAGLSTALLEKKLKNALKISGWSLKLSTVGRYHYPAKLLTVKGEKQFSSPHEIVRILKRSKLSAPTKAKAIAIIETIIRAESKVHGIPKDQVHFHELNSIDTLIDVAGSCLALEILGVDRVYSSPLNMGRPAPASLEIVKEKKTPVFSDNSIYELSTPTGTAVITNIAESFGPMPPMIIEKTGISTGTQVIAGKHNILQAFIGRPVIESDDAGKDKVVLLETNIDDMDPRIYPYVSELLLKSGAKDVWLTQIIMKKGRPGITLSVICDTENEGKAADIIFNETTTLGIRRMPITRHILPREYGKSHKTAILPSGKNRSRIEYETAKTQAKNSKTPLKTILRYC